MRSMLVSLGGDVPDDLRRWLRQGSTSVEIATGPDAAHAVDQAVERIVVWLNRDGSLPRGIDALEPTRVFYVSHTRGLALAGVVASQVFVWPDDKDKLRTALAVGNG